jgi:hypothetical protein
VTDITKCDGKGCSVRDGCHRFTTPSSGDGQSWMTAPGEDATCREYWPHTSLAVPGHGCCDRSSFSGGLEHREGCSSLLVTETSGDDSAVPCPWCGAMVDLTDWGVDGCLDAGKRDRCYCCDKEFQIVSVDYDVTVTLDRVKP